MPVPLISYPEVTPPPPPPPPWQGCPACRFIGRYCRTNCRLAPHFPPETSDGLEFITERLPEHSPTLYILSLSISYRPIGARVLIDVAAGRGAGFSDEARDLLIGALLSEVVYRDHDLLFHVFPEARGIPIIESPTIYFSCYIPDLRPLDDQL